MFCILDIESTGGAYGHEAIMEIALFRYDGNEITDQLISLVHPHKDVQKYVSKMTGITSKMLQRAPRFHEIAKRILEITDGAILVGHNVEFDYRMLRQEFERLGYPFEIKTLDTILLAQQLMPGLSSYGLDNVCREMGIYNPQVHRAEGDARATLELFQLLQEKDKEKEISIMGQSVLENTALKDKIQDLKRSVKINRGLYYLHDKSGKLLYLDFSVNIKQEINKLFMADDELAGKLREETHSIKTEATGNWLLARVKKQEEARVAKPRYGNVEPIEFSHHIIIDQKGEEVQFVVKPINGNASRSAILKAEDAKNAFRAIRLHRRKNREEQRNRILEDLLNFPEKAIYESRGRKPGEKCALVIRDHKWVGYFYFVLHEQIIEDKRLLKTLVPIEPKDEYAELLKNEIFSGELKRIH